MRQDLRTRIAAQRDYTLIAIASLALAGLALTRTYLRPLPLHRRVLVGIRERVGR